MSSETLEDLAPSIERSAAGLWGCYIILYDVHHDVAKVDNGTHQCSDSRVL